VAQIRRTLGQYWRPEDIGGRAGEDTGAAGTAGSAAQARTSRSHRRQIVSSSVNGPGQPVAGGSRRQRSSITPELVSAVEAALLRPAGPDVADVLNGIKARFPGPAGIDFIVSRLPVDLDEKRSELRMCSRPGRAA
jgi:hypothetical protein